VLNGGSRYPHGDCAGQWRKFCPLSSVRRTAPQLGFDANFTKLLWSYEWVSKSLTSHSTLYRSFQGRFAQARWPNHQCQSTEGSQMAAGISFNLTRTTPLCYNMNYRQPPLANHSVKVQTAISNQMRSRRLRGLILQLFIFPFIYSRHRKTSDCKKVHHKPTSSTLRAAKNVNRWCLWLRLWRTCSVFWVGLCLLVYLYLYFVYYCLYCLYLCSLPVFWWIKLYI